MLKKRIITIKLTTLDEQLYDKPSLFILLNNVSTVLEL